MPAPTRRALTPVPPPRALQQEAQVPLGRGIVPSAPIARDLALSLERLECDWHQQPLGSGGFADVYRGTYRFAGLGEAVPQDPKAYKDVV